jgi:DNA polymerase III alpha subunit
MCADLTYGRVRRLYTQNFEQLIAQQATFRPSPDLLIAVIPYL